VALSSFLAATGLGAADDAAFIACRDIAADPQRLACYDAAARAVTSDMPERSTAGATPVATPASRIDPEALFGLEAGATNEVLRSSSGIGDLTAMQSRVTAVGRAADGRLVITLANGQLWAQSDTEKLPVAAGDTVRIREASFGSFLLSRESGKRSIRVRRIR
jgi:hypothetical protein